MGKSLVSCFFETQCNTDCVVVYWQLTGQSTVLNYAPMIFHEVGFHTDTAAVLATLGLGVVKVTVAVAMES